MNMKSEREGRKYVDQDEEDKDKSESRLVATKRDANADASSLTSLPSQSLLSWYKRWIRLTSTGRPERATCLFFLSHSYIQLQFVSALLCSSLLCLTNSSTYYLLSFDSRQSFLSFLLPLSTQSV